MTASYIHGFSDAEQARLLEQARVLAPQVFTGLNFFPREEILELGCGVGAELKIISERWPDLSLTGLDLSRSHLAAARSNLSAEHQAGRVRLVHGDAGRLPFGAGSFDRVITIWMLEHVGNPVPILREALRVLKPGGRLVCTEVDNATFAFDPPVEAIHGWWDRFNEYQQSAGGDPFVGRKLAVLARGLASRDIETENLPIISSEAAPDRRRILLDYLRDLLLSGSDGMIASGVVGSAERDRLVSAFAGVQDDPHISFKYHAVRLTCRPPDEVSSGE